MIGFTKRSFFDKIFFVPVEILVIFPDSSMVEQFAVNEEVAGSNPARGAMKITSLGLVIFCYLSPPAGGGLELE